MAVKPSPPRLLHRREFLQQIAAATNLCATVPWLDLSRIDRVRAPFTAGPDIKVFVASGSIASWRGAEMSVEESARSAAMFGGSITLMPRGQAPPSSAAAGTTSIILGGTSLEDARKWA